MNSLSNFEILTSSRIWAATPWDYSSLRWIRFKVDDVSDCCYGYGQTIYAVIKFDFELIAENTLSIKYLDSPPLSERSFFKGFMPSQDSELKEISFQLKEEIFTGNENITGAKLNYSWNLELSNSPFPDALSFPYETPLIYYGHPKD